MKVLFLYPNLFGMNTLPPAIGLFTSILKKAGHELTIFDTTSYIGLLGNTVKSDNEKADNLNARPFDDSIFRNSINTNDAESDFRKVVRNFAPDLIAMSCTEDIFPVGVNLLNALGDLRPHVVAGGVFPTFSPELALRLSKGTIDFVLMGEGEHTLLQFCDRLNSNQDLSDIPGICFFNDGQFVQNKLPKPVNTDHNPLPDYSLFEESRYYRPMQGKLRRMIPIETIRGCPNRCAYCNSPSQMDIHKNEAHKFFRKSSISKVREEIEQAVNVYKADSIYFWADTFLAWGKKEFDKFCDMYSEFKLPFWIQTRPETVTEYKFRRLKEIGLLRVAFGIEHGNEKFRKEVLKRNVSNSSILENLKIVTDMGIPISVNNIIGFPGETRDLTFDTIELNRHIHSDGINAYTFVPFHGTPLRQLAEELGYVKPDALTRSIMQPSVLDMPQYPKEVIEGVRRCFVLYVKMPKDDWKRIQQAEQLTPEGDKVFSELKQECMENYMNYDDYDESEDIDALD